MDDPGAGVAEMARVVRPRGTVAVCSWDFAGGMEMLAIYWESVRAFDPGVSGESRSFGTLEELQRLWLDRGLVNVEARPLEVSTEYEDFDELWSSFLLGVGPAGEYVASLATHQQAALRDEYRRRLGEPSRTFTLRARTWAVRGHVAE
jgi:hypothetical protein